MHIRLRLAALAVTALVPLAGVAAAGPASAAPHVAAAGTQIIDGNGADLAIIQAPHGDAVLTASPPGDGFSAQIVGSNFQLKEPNGNCLTVNASVSDEIYSESCSSSTATLWRRSGTLYQSILLINAGKTGNLTAQEGVGGCDSAEGEVIFAKGGVPAGDCRISWAGPS